MDEWTAELRIHAQRRGSVVGALNEALGSFQEVAPSPHRLHVPRYAAMLGALRRIMYAGTRYPRRPDLAPS